MWTAQIDYEVRKRLIDSFKLILKKTNESTKDLDIEFWRGKGKGFDEAVLILTGRSIYSLIFEADKVGYVYFEK